MDNKEHKMENIILGGNWYEAEITECYTYLVLRDKFGTEYKFYFDAEGVAEMHAKLG